MRFFTQRMFRMEKFTWESDRKVLFLMKMGLFRDLVRARELELAYVMRWRLLNRERQERP